MAINRKRPGPSEEYDDLSLAKTPKRGVKLHGMLTEISPMKGGGKYFEGRLADSNTSLRFVGFDSTVQRKLMAKFEKKEPVKIENCLLQKSRYSEEMEVVVNKSASIQKSPRTFDDVVQVKTTVEEITLDKLQDIDICECKRVSVTVKAVQVKEKTEVKQGLHKQDITVADATGSCCFTLWQEDIGKIDVNKSYDIKNALVKSFNGSISLSSLRSETEITLVDDIDTCSVNFEPDQSVVTVADAEVAGVMNITSYINCISCKNKVDPVSDKIGVCSNCSISQRLDKCTQHSSAKLLIAKGSDMYELVAFLPIIKLIIQDDTVSFDDTDVTTRLLLSDPFIMTFDRNVIKTIYRP